MSNLVITVESGSDLTEEMARQYGIFIVPMYVQFKDETRADGSFPASDVCRYFKETGKVPRPAAVPRRTTEKYSMRSTASGRKRRFCTWPIRR